MSSEPLEVVRAFWDRVWLDRDLDALDELMSDPSIRHTADGTRSMSVDELRSHFRDALTAMRIESVDFEDVGVVGDTVWLRATIRALSLATMTPLPVAWLGQYRVVDGRITEAWALHQANRDWTH